MMLVASAAACSRDSDLVRVDRVDDARPEKREVGWLKDGKRHGQWLTYVEDEIYEVKHWHNGLRHGPTVSYFDGQAVWGDQGWHHGMMHGRDRIFREDGRIAKLGWYRYYKREGLWCHWHPHEDRLEKITEYQHGRVIREVVDPPGECPLTVGRGRRHLDPANRDYQWREPGGRMQRGIPLR